MSLNQIKSRVKRVIRFLQGKDFFPPVEVRCRCEHFGSEYGGWKVAVDYLPEDSVVYSFGVGLDISFDLALIERYGLTVHAFDPTPDSIRWVKQQNLPGQFILHEYGLADFDGEVTFYPPAREDYISHSMLAEAKSWREPITVAVKSLPTITKELGHHRIDLLKMDIEGAEYQVIANLKNHSQRPRQILVEFHHRFPGVGLEKTRQAMRQLKDLGYRLFSVSASGEEFGFLLQE